MAELKDPCPLDCGRAFHGLPKQATTLPRADACPGPFGVPTPIEGLEPEVREVCS